MIRNTTKLMKTSTIQSRFVYLALCVGVVMASFFGAQFVSAQTPSVMLSANGNASVNAAPGTQISLSWSGTSVSNCSINNGVGSVGIPGSRIVTMPAGGATYTITCNGGSDSVVLSVNPRVILSFQPNTVTAAQNGSASVRVRWNAVNATYCTNLTARGQSGARRTIFTNNRPTVDSFVDNDITEMTTYTIECTNTQNNRSDSDTKSITAFVPYGPPTISSFTVTREAGTNGVYDVNWGGALVRAQYVSSNVDFCERTATQAGVTTNIPGWTGASGSFGINGESTYIFPIARTTVFTVRCSRNSTNATPRTVTFTVPVRPTGAGTGNPTALITVPQPPTVSVPQASNLPARVGVSTIVSNVNRCDFLAFRPGTNTAINVPGWTDRPSDWWNRSGEFDIRLNESARLELECTRTSDNLVVRDQKTITVSVANLTPTLTFSGVVVGTSNNTPDLELNWSSQNTNYCNATNVVRNGNVVENWHAYETPPLGGVRTVDVVGSGEYRITCGNTGSGQSVTEEVIVTIDGSGNATVVSASVNLNASTVSANISASANGGPATTGTLNITPGDAVSVTWSGTNASSCRATNIPAAGFSTGNAVSNTDTTVIEPVAGFSQDFTITCYGPTGTSTPATVTVSANAGAPTATITASANGGPDTAGTLTVNDTASVSVDWSSTDATTCTPGGTGAGFTTGNNPGGTDPVTRPASGQSRTFTVTCTGPGGVSTPATVTVTTSAALPTVTLTANPTNVPAGTNTTLTWTSTNATTCTGSNGWSGNKTPVGGGSQSVTVTGDTTYTITCTGPGGSSGPVSVSVNSTGPQDLASSLDLTAQPTVVRRNTTTSLQWSFDPQFLVPAFSSGCSIQSGAWTSGPLLTATGNITSPSITAERLFELVCGGVTNAPDDASVRVRIIPLVQES